MALGVEGKLAFHLHHRWPRAVRRRLSARAAAARDRGAVGGRSAGWFPMFLNHYQRPGSDYEWSDTWSCQVYGDCPNCGFRYITPSENEDAHAEPRIEKMRKGHVGTSSTAASSGSPEWPGGKYPTRLLPRSLRRHRAVAILTRSRRSPIRCVYMSLCC
jgi:hypothetical protein